jgi:hypothetical protein
VGSDVHNGTSIRNVQGLFTFEYSKRELPRVIPVDLVILLIPSKTIPVLFRDPGGSITRLKEWSDG